jgi:hypothetical protein
MQVWKKGRQDFEGKSYKSEKRLGGDYGNSARRISMLRSEKWFGKMNLDLEAGEWTKLDANTKLIPFI